MSVFASDKIRLLTTCIINCFATADLRTFLRNILSVFYLLN